MSAAHHTYRDEMISGDTDSSYHAAYRYIAATGDRPEANYSADALDEFLSVARMHARRPIWTDDPALAAWISELEAAIARLSPSTGTVAKWLRDLDSASLAAPLAVKIGRQTYYGASYRDQVSGNFCLYLLGNIPPSYKRSQRTVYRFANDPHDWYVAGFADAAVAGNPTFARFHPFGAWFQLRAWPHELGQTIDQFESRSYRRVPIAEVL